MRRTAYSIDEKRTSMISTSLRPGWALLTSVAILLSAAAGGLPVAAAELMALDGAWSGGGSVKFPSGAKEAARCRANFKKRGAESYQVSARCASPSGKVEQSALLTYVGSNQYSGSFFNTEYKVDGTITVTVTGNSQNVSITTPAGSSATFRLTR
jgi:hypothetical protein